jgi:hypothetical protein
MFKFFRKKTPNPVKAIRLTTLEPQLRADFDRPALVEILLQAWSEAAGCLPDSYDIYGPYGIPKGRGVGLRAFRNRLRDRGHADDYGYLAADEQRGGVYVSFLESPPYPADFCEIVLWFRSSVAEVDAAAIVSRIAAVIPIDYGYLSELNENQAPLGESIIRRHLFGGTSIEVGNNALSRWHRNIHAISSGGLRDIYRLNFLNQKQLARLRQCGDVEAEPITGDLYSVPVESAAQRRELRTCLSIAADTPT